MGIVRDNVFSETPPLETVRLLMRLMMTESKQAKSYKPMCVNMSRAHFHLPSRRRVNVELLQREGGREGGRGWCGLLLKCTCGTRDVAGSFAVIVMAILMNMRLEV